jgi:hypothetical protein
VLDAAMLVLDCAHDVASVFSMSMAPP